MKFQLNSSTVDPARLTQIQGGGDALLLKVSSVLTWFQKLITPPQSISVTPEQSRDDSWSLPHATRLSKSQLRSRIAATLPLWPGLRLTEAKEQSVLMPRKEEDKRGMIFNYCTFPGSTPTTWHRCGSLSKVCYQWRKWRKPAGSGSVSVKRVIECAQIFTFLWVWECIYIYIL